MIVRIWIRLAAAAAMMMALAGCKTPGVSMSSDGRVAVSHTGELWVADVDREDWQRVPVTGKAIGAPEWSPDNRYLLVQTQEDETKEVRTSEGAAETDTITKPVTVLCDTVTGDAKKLRSEIGPPFAWRAESQGFIALHREGETTDLAWYSLDVSLERTSPSLGKLDGARDLKWLPLSDEIGFRADYTETDRQGYARRKTGLYVAGAGHIVPIPGSESAIGFGLSRDKTSLIWAGDVSDGRRISISLHSYDIKTGVVSALAFPLRPFFVKWDRGYEPSIASATFSPNGERLALVVYFTKAGKPGQQPDGRVACYSVEIDGTGGCLVRLSDADNAGLIPAWSHDGKRMAILDHSAGEPRLFIYNADGSGKRMASLPATKVE